MATTPQSVPESAPTAPAPLAPPSPADHLLYRAYRSGISLEDICAAQGVTESDCLAAIRRVRADNQRFSSEEAGLAVRRLLFDRMTQIGSVVDSGLAATRFHGKKVLLIDNDTGKVDQLEEAVEVPDHDTRLRTLDSLRTLLAVVQPRDPAISITNTTNTQNNTLNAGAGGGAAGLLPGATSPEAVIRAVVAQRQLAAPAAEGENPMPRLIPAAADDAEPLEAAFDDEEGEEGEEGDDEDEEGDDDDGDDEEDDEFDPDAEEEED